ncbi:DUF4440 domain-containing protein [Bacillus smithii]|uniref:nuclear transport factor 2 family protein n=1 Tax=Bacillus smithii TaxID=1479 RepID=UPI003D1BBD17
MENKSALKKHLCQLEQMLLKPEIRSSPKEPEKLLADDFFEFGSSGVDEGGLSIRKMTLYDFEINPLSEDVVLTTFRVKDDTRMQDTLRSSIWKFCDGRWQMFFHQGTLIKS